MVQGGRSGARLHGAEQRREEERSRPKECWGRPGSQVSRWGLELDCNRSGCCGRISFTRCSLCAVDPCAPCPRCELPYERGAFYCTEIKLALFTSPLRVYLEQYVLPPPILTLSVYLLRKGHPEKKEI